ncbi:MAG: Sec-independent protein translocase protein TatB [Rhodovibrionaceae bacterium]
MFDIGWTEMAVIALLALVVIGPKDLPKVLRTMGQWVRKARSLTREFQSGLDDMIRESELDDAKKAIETGKNFNVKKAVQDSVDPTGELEEEGKTIESSAKRGLREDEMEAQSGTAQSGTAETSKTKAGSSSSGEAEPEKRARVIKHPHQQAPGNSVKPPAEEGAAPKPEKTQSATAKTESSEATGSSAKPAPKESSG